MSRTTVRSVASALLEGLTAPQAEAVQHADGPLLVLAGAGAGKTRVITRRAAHLAATVARADQVLAITFTNKAANEMQERVLQLGVGGDMTVCTFHSLCVRLLRTHHERAGLPRDFTIFDSADQRKVIKEAVIECGLATENWSPAKLQSIISNAKNAMLTPAKFAEQPGDWGHHQIARIYQAYETALAKQHGLDFDDLLMRMAMLLRKDEALRTRLEERFRYVLIDEYQDTNLAQYEIARLLTLRDQNLCATGDPDQSIYGWRGADIRNILKFEEDYPAAKVVRLEQNYRSSKRILSAASSLIEHNVHRKHKTLWTENDEGPAVRVLIEEDGSAEAAIIAQEIMQRRERGQSLSDIAVFYRINALSRVLEEAFIQSGIAYQVARGTEFYNRKEIKDVLGYARVLVNRFDEVSLTRIINTPARGIGNTTVDRLTTHARATGQPLIDVLLSCDKVASLRRPAIERLKVFVELLRSLAELVDSKPREALEQIVSQSGIRAELNEKAEFDPEPMANVDELINAAAMYEAKNPDGNLVDWLQYTSLLGDVDEIQDERGMVTLMTLHAAKGLEFPVVYMIGLEEGMLPFRRQQYAHDEDLEEERRLCFVGMTRSKRELTLCHCRYRMIRGMSEQQASSRFLDELPRDEIEWIEPESRSGSRRRASGGAGHLPQDLDEWQVGTLVRHDSYGIGKIMRMRPNGRQIVMAVKFRDGTERAYTLGYAPLERLDFDDVGDE